MPPKGPDTAPGAPESPLQDKRENAGLVGRLKEMIAGDKAETPAELSAQQQLAEVKAKNAADTAAREQARREDLQRRADSGEVPVVPADQRYQTGQTPAVPESASPIEPENPTEPTS